MNLARLLTLLAAAALAATPAAAQTIKSLGFNTTNGQVVYSGTNPLTFTNALSFGTNAAATASNLGLGATSDVVFLSLNAILDAGEGNEIVFNSAIFFDDIRSENIVETTRTNLGGTTVGNAVFTATNPAAGATALGLGTTNSVTFSNLTTTGTLTATGNATLNGVANTAPSQTASSGASLMTRDLVGQEFANPRTRIQQMYWFGMEGLGEWSTIGTAAVSAYLGSGPGFGGCRTISSSGRIGTNHAGAGLRLGSDTTAGGAPYRFSDGGALTMRAQVRKGSVVPRPAIAFLMGARTATQMWQQDAYGLYFVPQPTNVWTSNGVVTQHDRIAVSNVVWSVNTAGTNDTTEPVWTDLIGSLVTNGSAVYRNLGPHTSNNWVLAIGSTNASGVVMTNTGKVGPPNNNRQEVILKLRISGTTNTPYTIFGSVETGVSSGNSAGESAEVSLTTTNNDFRQPQFWSRFDEEGGLAVQPDPVIRYFAIDGQMPPLF